MQLSVNVSTRGVAKNLLYGGSEGIWGTEVPWCIGSMALQRESHGEGLGTEASPTEAGDNTCMCICKYYKQETYVNIFAHFQFTIVSPLVNITKLRTTTTIERTHALLPPLALAMRLVATAASVSTL